MDQALSDIKEFQAAYRVLLDPEEVWEHWNDLVRYNRVTGFRVHDAYLAAVMRGHQITDILTLNISDFQGFQGIRPLLPDQWKDIR